MPKEYFDQQAATWDNNPQRLELAKSVADTITNYISIHNHWTALDYGCGTGSLSFFLNSNFKSITLADESQGMLDVLATKIQTHNTTHLHPLKLNLLEDTYTATHDVIYSMMAMHHILDTKAILTKFYSILDDDGYLCIADLVEEDGSFHALHDDFVGHNGFNIQQLHELLNEVGFKDVLHSICFEMKKEFEGKIVNYPIFLMIATK